MKTKIFLAVFIMLLLFGTIPYNTGALGEQTDYTEDFEDDTLTQQATDNYYGSLWFNTYTTETNTYVDNSQAVDTKSYRIYRNKNAFFNFTYANTTNILKLTHRLRLEGFLGTADHRTFKYYDSDGTCFLYWRIGDGSGAYELDWIDFNGVNDLTDLDDTWDDKWLYVEITIISNDTVYFNLSQSGGDYRNNSGVSTAPYVVVDNPRINYSHVWCNVSDSRIDTWFDNFNIRLGTISAQPDETTIPPCSPDSTIGELAQTGLSRGITGDQYLWTVYAVNDVHYIHRLDLEIDMSMIDTYNIDLTDLYCKINEYALGNPTELIQLGTDSDYRVSWTGLNIFVNNTPTTISFRNTQSFATNQYWIIPYTNEDINNDGTNFWISYSNNGWWNNQGLKFGLPLIL